MLHQINDKRLIRYCIQISTLQFGFQENLQSCPLGGRWTLCRTLRQVRMVWILWETNCVLRSDTLCPGCTPYFNSEKTWEGSTGTGNVYKSLGALLGSQNRPGSQRKIQPNYFYTNAPFMCCLFEILPSWQRMAAQADLPRALGGTVFCLLCCCSPSIC